MYQQAILKASSTHQALPCSSPTHDPPLLLCSLSAGCSAGHLCPFCRPPTPVPVPATTPTPGASSTRQSPPPLFLLFCRISASPDTGPSPPRVDGHRWDTTARKFTATHCCHHHCFPPPTSLLVSKVKLRLPFLHSPFQFKLKINW